MKTNQLPELEILIGIVSPLGSNREPFIEKLSNEFIKNNYEFVKIPIVELLFGSQDKLLPKPLDYFIKMQVCSQLRFEYSNAILVKLVIDFIKNYRRNTKSKKAKRIVYLIDQLKNVYEYKALSHIYGLNYIQISLFSNQIERDNFLKNKFKDVKITDNIVKTYNNACKNILSSMKVKIKKNEKKFSESLLTKYCDEILPDATHKLMEKDFTEIDDLFIDNKSGQQISDIFHRSHYFINLDLHENEVNKEIDKFINLLLGKNQEYPTQDEFGMSLAFQASVRSNFPGDRHIGAAIISEYGEIISVASIRAPSQKSSNPTLDDRLSIQTGYELFHEKIKGWKVDFSTLIKNKNIQPENKDKLEEINRFLGGLLDFHPCTHAEIAAIIDAAKLGVSIRNSTLYTTTFPCHLCAKDIINAGIKRVVYLEAYPKSKNKDLYPNLIDFDPKFESELIPFNFYWGIGPKRFIYAYSLENKITEENSLPPLLKYETPEYYDQRESDVKKYLENLLAAKPKTRKNLTHLDDLLRYIK